MLPRFNLAAAYGPDREHGDPVKTKKLSDVLTRTEKLRPAPVIPILERTCAICARTLPAIAFYHRSGAAGVHSYCVDCHADINKINAQHRELGYGGGGARTLRQRLTAKYAAQWPDRIDIEPRRT